MRKIMAAATFGLVLSVAAASDPYDQTPESRAYLSFSFGGDRAMPHDFHYGLRFDQSVRFEEGQARPLMQFDFTRRGLSDTRVNGVSVIKHQYRLRQAEDPAAEPPAEQPAEQPAGQPAEAPAGGGSGDAAAAEEPGFFAKTWAGFKGLFSGGDEEAPAEETAAAEEPAEEAGEEVSEGTFLNYNVIDWGLLAVGAVGLGFAVGEVSNGEDSPDSGSGGNGGNGGNGGCLPGEVENPAPDPLDELPDCIPAPSGFVGIERFGGLDIPDPAHQEWLDGGTGHMGDLGVQD